MAKLTIAEISATTARLKIAAMTTAGTNKHWVRGEDGVFRPTWRTSLTAGPSEVVSFGWSPVRLVAPPRPSGAGYQRYEDVVGATQNAVTGIWSVNLETAFNLVGAGKVMTLPEGIFECYNFERTSMQKGFTFGRVSQGYTGQEGVANSGPRGIVGSGFGTIIRPAASITTNNPDKIDPAVTSGSPDYIRGTTIEFYKIPGLEFGNLKITGKPTAEWDGDYFGAVVVDSCHGANLHHLSLRGASPGYHSMPPGETFGINFYRANDARITDSEIDGRHTTTDTRVCASPIGWNGSGTYPNYVYATNATVERCYSHHGVASMLTFFKTSGITVTDYWAFSTAKAGKAGHGINFEQIGGGDVTLTRCYLFLNRTTATAAPPYPLPAGDQQATAGSFHLSLNIAGIPGDGVMRVPNVRVIEPVWDKCYASSVNPDPGMFMIECPDGYAGGVSGASGIFAGLPSCATVIKNGVTLTASNHPTSNWQNQDPAAKYAWIH